METKTLFVIISKDIIRRNIFDTAFWDTLIAKKDSWRVVLVVENEKVAWYQERVGDTAEVVGYARAPHKGWAKVVNFLVRSAGNTHSMRTYRNRALKRGQSSFASYCVKACIANVLGGVSWYQGFVRYLVQHLPNNKTIGDLYVQYKPNLVFAPSLIDNDFDVLFGVESRRRNIPVVGMVRSWDNLNNHGLLAFIPDELILQNKWLKESGERYQSIDFGETPHTISGLPHYDRYEDLTGMLLPREEFFNSLALDPHKKLIFLAGFDFYYSEDTLPGVVDKLVENGKIEGDVQILFTQHPASLYTKEDYRIDELKNVVYLNLFAGKPMGFMDTEQTFINIAYYADVIVNVASTVAIDAAVLDKPVVCIGFDDPQKNLSRWEEVGRLHDHFDHYEHLHETGATSIARSPEELAEQINQYLASPAHNHEGRMRAREEFVAPFDGRAGERVATAVLRHMARIR